MRTLQFYLIKELIPPIILSGLFFTFVLLVLRLFGLADLLLDAGVGGGVLTHLMSLVVLTVLSLTIPMAVLLGTLIAVGRLTSENEVLAMRVAGISIARAFWPTLALGLLASFGLMWANQFAIPRVFASIDETRYQIQFDVLTNLKPGQFYPDLGGKGLDMTLYYEDRATKPGQQPSGLEMEGVNLRIKAQRLDLMPGAELDPMRTSERPDFQDLTPQERQEIRQYESEMRSRNQREFLLFSDQGQIKGDPQTGAVVMNLEKGTLVPVDWSAPGNLTEVRFGKMAVTVTSGSEDAEEIRAREPREMTGTELLDYVQNRMPPGYTQQDFSNKIRRVWRVWFAHRVELYRRITLPLSIVAFLLIGVPLAIEVRPRAKSFALLLAFGLMAAYYALMTLGASMAATGISGPMAFGALMIPNVVIGGIGAALWFRANRR